MKQLLLDIKPVAQPSLQNFVIGRNAEALSNLLSTIENREHFIYIWGEKGCGKTHLLTACDAYGIMVADDVHLLDNDAQIDLFNNIISLKNMARSSSLQAPIPQIKWDYAMIWQLDWPGG